MSETTETDEVLRNNCMMAAMWFFDSIGEKPRDPQHVCDIAAVFEHYLTEGQTIAIVAEHDAKVFRG